MTGAVLSTSSFLQDVRKTEKRSVTESKGRMYFFMIDLLKFEMN
jgi:hypothetical protein